MDSLAVLTSEARRGRTLSFSRPQNDEKARMDQSLDNLHALFSEVQYDWRQATESDANPLDLALPLLDNTSVGLAHRRGEFQQLQGRISNGLRQAVNEHYQAFNDSIGSYRSVVQNITQSQSSINKVKETVSGSIGDLKGSDEILSSLNDNIKSYNDMIVILSAIEEVKQAPADLENAFTEKNYSKAQSILHSVRNKAEANSLWKLPALTNLQNYFKTQEDLLFDVLVEQLHDIMYSKKVFDTYNSVEEFLKQSTLNEYSGIENYVINSIDTDIANSSSAGHTHIQLFLKNLNATDKPVLDSTIGEESEYNELTAYDETNPFNQIYHILQIIHDLGKFSSTMEIIIQRIASEINQLINRIVENTKLKHSKLIKSLNSGHTSKNFLRLLTDDNYSSVVLQDLFWNFFRKLLFYEQAIFVIIEINKKLEINHPDLEQLSTTDSEVGSSLDLNKLWELLNVEIRNFILTYISSDDPSPLHTKINTKSDAKANSLFQFYHVDYNKDHTTEMKSILQDLFPGFINFNDMSKIDSPYIEDNKFMKQSKIIPSTILNMRHILEPFLLFVQGSALLLPAKQEDFISYFNSFMVKDFLPLLEESFIHLYYEEVEETDPLQIYEPVFDVSSAYNVHDDKKQQIFKIFVEFKTFLNNLCYILSTSLQFRKEFSGIIFKLITKFQEKIQEIHDDLFNEIINYLEPNKELIQSLKNQSKTAPTASNVNINRSELKHSNGYLNYVMLRSSINFLLTLLETKLIKTVDLSKTDLNLTTVEKLRKNWSFFTMMSFKNDVYGGSEGLDLDNVNQIILNDDLKKKYDAIVEEYKKTVDSMDTVLNKLDAALQIVEYYE